MAYLHSINILHRDLKPANILINEFLYPKLADFGLPKDLSCTFEECQKLEITQVIGTPTYIAPEIYYDAIYTKEGDVYSFGLIVYEIITLNEPNIGSNIFQIIYKVVKEIKPQFDIPIPNCYKNLIES